MNIKKYFKLYLVSILVLTFLFFLVFVFSINIIKSEIRTYLESGEFEKKNLFIHYKIYNKIC